MSETELNISTHYLHPSMLHTSVKPCRVTTVLGSCVAVCLHDIRLKTGGINHYMLPLWNGDGLASPKYGNVAIEKLLEHMIRQGSQPQHLIAKIFGGAKQMDGAFDVGSRNVMLAHDKLKELSIKVMSESTLGTAGRKIIYETHTGLVQMKFLSNLHSGSGR